MTRITKMTRMTGISVWALTCSVIAAAFLWLAWIAYDEYHSVLNQEYRVLSVKARQRQANLSGALRSVDLLLQSVVEDWTPAVDPLQILTEKELTSRLRQFPEVSNLLITDAQGRVLVSNRHDVTGLDVADREYFQVHRQATVKPDDFHVTRPFRTRRDDTLVISVSRALRDAQGHFLGVVNATIAPKLFDDILRIDECASNCQSVLINREGDIINAYPAALASQVGKNLQGGIAFGEHMASGVPMTRHLNEVKLAQVKRASVFLDVPHSGLIIVMSRDHADIMADWQKAIIGQFIGFIAAAGLALFLAPLVVRRERHLVRSEAFARNLIETANVMVVGLDDAGRISLFNAAAEQLTGYTRAEVLGRDWFESLVPKEHFPEVWQEFVHVSTHPTIASPASQFENPILTKDGQVRHISWQNSRINDTYHRVAVLSFGRDITQKVEEEEALHASKAEVERLSSWKALLINSAGEGIYGVDLFGICTFINPVALSLLGFEEADVLGKDQHALFHYQHTDGSHYAHADCPIYQTLRDGVMRQVETSFIHKNGVFFPVQMTVAPIIQTGIQTGAVVVFQDITQRKKMEAELTRLATTDELTGCANRRHFMRTLTLELARIQRHSITESALLMFDLDHFKQVNDRYGHAAGDLVLQVFTDGLRAFLRKTDLAGRLGGEEFALLLTGTHLANAQLLAERLRQRIADTTIPLGEHSLVVTTSVGVTVLQVSDADAESALARADAALYAAKHQGRNRVVVWDASIRQTTQTFL